ncbi:hypothetical protein EFE32_06860 [Lactococcus lactis subsp. lactis]|jgi:Uncharacterized conserved protein|uniref:SOS response-associated peptidase n=1 Tax=Lactococcus lactis TaxID=1358 RepID=UPI00223C4E20|nr:SOS response-associated peptidase [Lactococcus lactis]MCT0016563.1 hypothetical protein [Lactococcus lactis subsp. lactis]
MCGRFALNPYGNEMLSKLVDKANARLMSDWQAGEHEQYIDSNKVTTGEVFPTNTILTLIRDRSTKNVGAFGTDWGIQAKSLIINARSETIKERYTFKALFPNYRCVIPTTGFYEWQHLDDKKKKGNKFYLGFGEDEPLFLAGLYKAQNKSKQSVILTTKSNESMKDIHERMPLILEAKNIRNWLFDEGFAYDYLQANMPNLARQKV